MIDTLFLPWPFAPASVWLLFVLQGNKWCISVVCLLEGMHWMTSCLLSKHFISQSAALQNSPHYFFLVGLLQSQLKIWRDQRSLSHSISTLWVHKWDGKRDLVLILAWQDCGCGWEGANLRAQWDKLQGGGLLTWKYLAVPQRTSVRNPLSRNTFVFALLPLQFSANNVGDRMDVG